MFIIAHIQIQGLMIHKQYVYNSTRSNTNTGIDDTQTRCLYDGTHPNIRFLLMVYIHELYNGIHSKTRFLSMIRRQKFYNADTDAHPNMLYLLKTKILQTY